MSQPMEQILEYLARFKTLKVAMPDIFRDQGGLDIELDAVQPLHPAAVSDPSVLYFGRVTQLPSDPAGFSLVLIADAPLPDSVGRVNRLILFDPDTPAEELRREIVDYFSFRTSFMRNANEIMQAVLRQKPVNDVFDLAGRIIGRTIIVGDRFLNVIAGPRDKSGNLYSWNDYIEMGLATPHGQDKYFDTLERVRVSHNAVVMEPKNPATGRVDLMVAIEFHGSMSAVMGIIGAGKPFSYWDKRYIPVLADALIPYLSGGERVQSRHLPFEQFMLPLLDGNAGDTESIRFSASQLSLDPDGLFSMLIVAPETHAPMYHRIVTLRNAIESHLGDSLSAVHSNRLVFLLSYRSQAEYDAHNLGDAETFFQNHDIYAARSRLFSGIENTRHHYNGTLRLLTLQRYAPEGVHILRDVNLGVYPIALALIDCGQAEEFIDSNVTRLLELDKKRNTELADTLFSYIRHSKNSTRASEELHIHRNTLNKRILKISELTDIDWDDGDHMFRLQLSMCILRIIEAKA